MTASYIDHGLLARAHKANLEILMSDLNIEHDAELAALDAKEIDVLSLMRRWPKQLGKLSQENVDLVLNYLNTKHGRK